MGAELVAAAQCSLGRRQRRLTAKSSVNRWASGTLKRINSYFGTGLAAPPTRTAVLTAGWNGVAMTTDLTSLLNDLIETSKDGEKGFRAAAEDTKNAELKEIFLKRSQDCTQGASELQRLVAEMGGEPEQGGSIAGAIHRGWVEVTSAVSKRSDLAILEECERGEDVAKAKYRKALEDSALSEEARAVVQRQYDGVLRNHDQIRDLRDRYRTEQTQH